MIRNGVGLAGWLGRADPFAKKDWYDVKAPSVFEVRNVGKTLVSRTQGTKVRTPLCFISLSLQCFCFFLVLFAGINSFIYLFFIFDPVDACDCSFLRLVWMKEEY